LPFCASSLRRDELLQMEKVVSGALQRLSAADIIRVAGLTAASLGQEYNRTATIENMQRQGTRLRGIISITEAHDAAAPATEETEALPSLDGVAETSSVRIYPVEVEISSATNWTSTCPCHADRAPHPGLCAHAAALLYRWVAQPATFEVVVATNQQEKAPPIRSQKKQLTHTSAAPEYLAARSNAHAQSSANSANNSATVQYSEDLVSILQQLSLGELRGIAHEYNLAHNGSSKLQIAEMIVAALRQPENVRRSAATLAKEPRQLLAALVLAGGMINDDDLRGLFERFSLGQPAQLQRALLDLQSKALLFRTNSLGSEGYARSNPDGNWLDIGWFVPQEVRTALRVSVPVSPFDVEHASEKYGALKVQTGEPARLLADLLLVARALSGYRVGAQERWLPGTQDSNAEATSVPPANAATTANPLALTRAAAPNPVLHSDPALPLPLVSDLPPEAVVQRIATQVPRSPAYLRHALHILTQAGIVYRGVQDENGRAVIRVLPEAAQLLLGSPPEVVLADLFHLWLRHASAHELYELMLEGVRIHLRSTTLNIPIVRVGELEEENREARQTLSSLLALTPCNEWINFQGFARFVYRLTPHFLQRRQRFYSSPHWWFEREGSRALRPLHFADWQKAELLYLTKLVQGPLSWWGLCDCIYSEQNQLVAFRLTALARWLLHDEQVVEVGDSFALDEHEQSGNFAAHGEHEILVPCVRAAWPLIAVCEACTEPGGVCDGMLVYRLTPRALGAALNSGDKRAQTLLSLLQREASNTGDAALRALVVQVEQWYNSYGRVRLYTGMSLLEVADTAVLREVSAYTHLEAYSVQQLQPTIHIVKKDALTRLVDDVKRHGLTPLVHNEDDYGAE
jgi:hypothetical protein